MTDYKRPRKKRTAATWLTNLSGVLFLGGLLGFGLIGILAPAQIVPLGVIGTTKGTVTACRDGQIAVGKKMENSGFPTYSFVYNDRTYTGENPTESQPCSDERNRVGSTVTIYFIQSDPTKSAFTQDSMCVTHVGAQGPTCLYTEQFSPGAGVLTRWFLMVAVSGLVLGLVTAAVSIIRRRRSPPKSDFR